MVSKQRNRTDVLIALCLVISAVPPSAQMPDWPQTVSSVKRSLCLITFGKPTTTGQLAPVSGSAGTGFLIDAKGHFVTAAHVLDAVRVRVAREPDLVPMVMIPHRSWPSGTDSVTGRLFPYEEVVRDSENDIAICRGVRSPLADEKTSSFALVAELGKGGAVPDGTEVTFVGFGLNTGVPLTVRGSLGAHGKLTLRGKPTTGLLVTAIGRGGHSGSPLFLKNGVVIGVVTDVGYSDEAGITIARPVSLVRALVGRVR